MERGAWGEGRGSRLPAVGPRRGRGGLPRRYSQLDNLPKSLKPKTNLFAGGLPRRYSPLNKLICRLPRRYSPTLEQMSRTMLMQSPLMIVGPILLLRRMPIMTRILNASMD